MNRLAIRFILLAMLAAPTAALAAGGSSVSLLPGVIRGVQPKVVKIYGAGGFQGMEPYQTGFLVSQEGHVLTVWSYVLDADEVSVVLFDGRKFPARLLGADPRLEIAVLKIDAADLPAFSLDAAPEGRLGERILAVSNLFGVASGNEPASVQRGAIAACTRLDARRGVFESPYRGPIYVLDVVTNNPGAAGGALVSQQGALLGLLGKELRNAATTVWLNYAIPIAQLRTSVAEIRAGKFVARDPAATEKKPQRPLTAALLGIALVPEVVERTPPYVDHVQPGSPAAQAGLRPDDLLLLVDDHLVPTCQALRKELDRIDFEDPVRVTLLRGQEMLEFTLRSASARGTP